MNVLNNKKINLVLLFASFVSYLFYCLLGIGTIGYESGGWYNGIYQSNLYDCLGAIFVPIVGLLFLILIPLTLLFYFGKLRFVRIHKFMSAVDFLGVFGVSLAQGILVLCYCNIPLTTLGTFVNIFIILTCVLSFLSAVLCLINLFTMPKFVTTKKAKIIKNKESESAAQKLKTLKKLFDDGVITKEEYDEKKQKYIDML